MQFLFAKEARIYLKIVLVTVHFVLFLGVGSKTRLSLKRWNVIFICIMKCKQTVYHRNKVEKVRIQTDCSNFFLNLYR